MAKIRSSPPRARWGGTKKQGEEFSRLRVAQARVKELETELANVRASERSMAEALSTANASVGTLRQFADDCANPNKAVIVVTKQVREILTKMAASGLWGRNVDETAAEIVREYVRNAIASGKVPTW